MASGRKEANLNDPWSIANALVGLFTFRVPKQTSNLSNLNGSSIQSSFSAGIGKAREDIRMRNAEDERPDSGGSSPIDQPPPTVSEQSQTSPSRSLPVINEESVICWAVNKVESGTPVNQLELLGLQNFLQKRHEPAREGTLEPEVLDLTGSATPTPGPSRAESLNGPSFTTSSSLPSITSGAKPRKMLQKNPNGNLHWRGAGSARVRPGSKSRVVRPVSGPNERREDRAKRRRLAEMDDNESRAGFVSSISEPAISLNGNAPGASVPSDSSGVHKTPRASVRTATPSIPSPLRQMTSNSPDSRVSARGHNGGPSVAQQRTHAATVLTELIESVTPPPKMTIANPYQNEAPVKSDYKPKPKPAKRMAERREELAKKEKEKKQTPVNEKKDYSAIQMIGATIPEGARRSIPSLPGNKSRTTNNVNGRMDEDNDEFSAKKRHRVTVEDAEDEETDIHREARSEEVPPQKKTKVTVETVDEDEGDSPTNSSRTTDETKGTARATSPSVSKAPSIFGVPKHSAKPREPSKLRTSIVAEEDDHTSGGPPYPSVLGSVPPAAANIFAKRAAETNAASRPVEPAAAPKFSAFPMSGQNLSTPLPTVVEEKLVPKGAKTNTDTPEDIALRKSKDTLPRYRFDVTVSVFDPKYSGAQKAALARKSSELPQYDFNKPLTNGTFNASESESINAKPAPVPTVPKEPVQAFNWALAGIKPQKAQTSGEWKCGICMLSNPASATEKCTVCESPR